MKKLIVLGCLLAGIGTMHAQELNICDQLGVGLNLGTNGIGVDVSTRITSFVGVRAGVNIMPKFKYKTDLDVSSLSSAVTSNATYQNFLNDMGIAALPRKISVEGKLDNTTWHILFDVYPFSAVSSFHLTAGAYFGKSQIVTVYNKEPGSLSAASAFNARVDDNGVFTYTSGGISGQISGVKKVGVELGDYFLEPTKEGNLDASFKVNGFRPYLGLGFGRAVPKNRIGVQFDMGCQFWGKPEIYCTGLQGEHKLDASEVDGRGGDVLKTLTKIAVYPVINLRITGRIL